MGGKVLELESERLKAEGKATRKQLLKMWWNSFPYPKKMPLIM